MNEGTEIQGGNQRETAREHQGQRGRRCSMAEQTFPKGHGPWKTCATAEEKSKEGATKRNHYVLTAHATTPVPLPFLAALRALSITCSHNKVGGEVSDVKSNLVKGMVCFP